MRVAASLILCCSLILSRESAAQSVLESGPLTETAVVAAALTANPGIASARARAAAAGELPLGRSALPDPALRVGLYGVPLNSLDPLDGQLRLQVTQAFPHPGTLKRRAELAEREYAWIAQAIPATQVSVAASARRAYYELWYAETAKTIHHGHLQIARRLADSAEERYATGDAPQENVLRALQKLTALLTEIEVVGRDASVARMRLNSILHRDPTRPLGAPMSPVLGQHDTYAPEWLLEEAERLNPSLAAARARIAVEQARVDSERHESKPDFAVSAELWTASDGMGGRFHRWAVLGTMTLPWVHDDKYSAAIGSALAAQTAAATAQLLVKDRVYDAVMSAWARAQSARRIAELYRTTLLPQSEQSLQAALAAYETSRADFGTVVDNERLLLANRLGLARIEADFGLAMADLLEAIGVTDWGELQRPSVATEIPAQPGGISAFRDPWSEAFRRGANRRAAGREGHR